MTRRLAQSTAYTVTFLAYLSTDHVSPATGKTIAVTISKAGGALGNPNAGASNATEISNGLYKFAFDTTDTGTLGDLVLRGTSSGVDDVWLICQVVSATTNGATNLDAAVSSRSSHSASDVWSVGTRLLTAGTNIALAKGTGVTGFNDLDAAGVRSAVGLASANLDTQIGDLPTNAELATALGTADDAVLSAIAALNDLSAADVTGAVWGGSIDGSLKSLTISNAAGIAVNISSSADHAVYIEQSGSHEAVKVQGQGNDAVLFQSLSGYGLSAEGTLGDIDADEIGGSAPSANDIADAVWEEALADHSGTSGSVAEALDEVKAKTDSLTFTVSGQVDANMQSINDTELTGDGSAGDKFGPD